MGRFCGKCGSELSDRMKFCPACGAPCKPLEVSSGIPKPPSETPKTPSKTPKPLSETPKPSPETPRPSPETPRPSQGQQVVPPPSLPPAAARKKKSGKRYIAAIMSVIIVVVLLRAGLAAISGRDGINNKGGDGKFTIMIYMCGTDLESDTGAATNDIIEMCDAASNDNVNVLMYTGGTAQWNNDYIRSDTNQIWQIKQGEILCLEEDLGVKSMADPATLYEFVSYCAEKYPAGRNALIMWDHGGGALHGVCSDEIFGGEAMQINEIDSALSQAGVKFDFIGFDACLMATVETACMLNRHADYMIASEELEPGSGWFYTDWLNMVCEDPSVSTEKIGERIIDSFVEFCNAISPEGQCTLSMIDLAEMENVYDKLCVFSENASEQLDEKQFRTVSYAVSNTKAFNESANSDLIDLMHFAQNCEVEGSKKLIDAVNEAVVYSAHSDNVSNANGMTIYLPYRNMQEFQRMLEVYNDIGLEGEYTEFISTFATIIAGGQTYKGSNTPVDAMDGVYEANGSSDYSEWSDYDWFDEDYASEYEDVYEESESVTTQLQIEERGAYYALPLTNENWEIVTDVKLQLFYDTGEGYIDLGTDNYFDYDTDNALIVDYDGFWFSLNGYIVPISIFSADGYREGYIPCMLNGEKVQLVVWLENNGGGYVVGAIRQYDNGMSMKGFIPVEDGDEIQLICDYYTYAGELENSYTFYEPFLYDSSDTVSYISSGAGKYYLYYVITDIYNNTYYTEPVIRTF